MTVIYHRALARLKYSYYGHLHSSRNNVMQSRIHLVLELHEKRVKQILKIKRPIRIAINAPAERQTRIFRDYCRNPHQIIQIVGLLFKVKEYFFNPFYVSEYHCAS